LRRVQRAERAWLQGEAGNAVLVVGGPGSGKTSLLNVASLKLGTRELSWPSADNQSQRVGLLAALAAELRCEVDEAAILRRLHDRQRAIVIDDLERLLPLGGAALDELELLLRLVAETKSSCFWLLAVGRTLQRLVDPLSPLRVGLAEVVELGRLEEGELANMLEQALADGYLKDPHVTVILTERENLEVSVLGEVEKPGSFPFAEKLTLVQAISDAGGLTDVAHKRRIRLTRKTPAGPQTYEVSVKAITDGREPDILLQPGDIIFVPESPI
ncbi:MAG: SLBB domain-containing protein, partial [Myxococcales bacterium]|nr:SLBB domain-containing protein [Myxococcales bacterium]